MLHLAFSQRTSGGFNVGVATAGRIIKDSGAYFYLATLGLMDHLASNDAVTNVTLLLVSLCLVQWVQMLSLCVDVELRSLWHQVVMLQLAEPSLVHHHGLANSHFTDGLGRAFTSPDNRHTLSYIGAQGVAVT